MMDQDLSVIYGAGDSEDFYRLLSRIHAAKFEPMPNFGGSIYFGRVEPPFMAGGYTLSWVASALYEPTCTVEDAEVAGWIIEVSKNGMPWFQYHNRKMYDTREVAMHSLDQIRRVSTSSLSFRVSPVYRFGPVSVRSYNIYKIIGGSFEDLENVKRNEGQND